MAYAHQHGVQVWAVVDNGFNGPLSHQILAYRDQQNMLITHIVQEAVNAHINGINLDFEGLLPEDRWNFTDFVQKLATALHAHHMDLSVDLPPDIVPDDNTGAYNHSALAKAANYIILMGYDEYWGGEQIAGPTASYPWVKQSINDMLNTGVPSSKLILGLPFYTQDWTVGKNDSALASEALSLWQTRTLLASTHAKETWNAKLGLHVASFVQNGVKHEIWIEDKRSLLLFADLVSEQHLAWCSCLVFRIRNKNYVGSFGRYSTFNNRLIQVKQGHHKSLSLHFWIATQIFYLDSSTSPLDLLKTMFQGSQHHMNEHKRVG